MVTAKILCASLLFALSAFMPCQSLRRTCEYKDEARDLILHGDAMVAARPGKGDLIIVDPDTLDTMALIPIPDDLCDGSCYPFSVAIKEDENAYVLAVAAKTQLSGGDNKILFFRIDGDSILRISDIYHYYTMPDDMLSGVLGNSPDIRSIAFCGDGFALADYYGRIKYFKMLTELEYDYVKGKPEPNRDTRVSWYLDSSISSYNDYGRTEYLRCSNNGSYWLIGKDTTQYYSYDKIAAVPSTIDTSSDIFQLATISFDSSILNVAPRFALTQVRGLAMDNDGNFYFASGDGNVYSNTNYGVYVRSPSGTVRPIKEWQDENAVKFFGIAATNQQVLYTVEKHGSETNYICKYDNF